MRRKILACLMLCMLCSGGRYVLHAEDCLSAAGSAAEFMVYKTFCCSPPILDAESGEGFFVKGEPSQPIPKAALKQIRNLDAVADALPILQFRIREQGRLVCIEGIDTKGIEHSEAILNAEFAAEMRLGCGDVFRVRGRSYTIKKVVPPCSNFPGLDVFLTCNEAGRLITQGSHASGQEIMNLILVKLAEGADSTQIKEHVKTIVGASSRFATTRCGPKDTSARKTALRSCECGEEKCR